MSNAFTKEMKSIRKRKQNKKNKKNIYTGDWRPGRLGDWVSEEGRVGK